VQVSRQGSSVELWGQVRPGSGARGYAIQRATAGGWATIGGTKQTGRGGTFLRTLTLPAGARVRLSAPSIGWTSPPLKLS
jgi:hypothetical protein